MALGPVGVLGARPPPAGWRNGRPKGAVCRLACRVSAGRQRPAAGAVQGGRRRPTATSPRVTPPRQGGSSCAPFRGISGPALPCVHWGSAAPFIPRKGRREGALRGRRVRGPPPAGGGGGSVDPVWGVWRSHTLCSKNQHEKVRYSLGGGGGCCLPVMAPYCSALLELDL